MTVKYVLKYTDLQALSSRALGKPVVITITATSLEDAQTQADAIMRRTDIAQYGNPYMLVTPSGEIYERDVYLEIKRYRLCSWQHQEREYVAQ